MTVVVTGAAGAIGTALSSHFSTEHPLVLVDRSPAVRDLARELSGGGRPAIDVVADLGAPDLVSRIETAVASCGEPLRVLVNNAGVTRDGRLRSMSREDFETVVDVNLIATMRLTMGLLPSIENGGSVVSISSRAGLGNFGQCNYVAAKSGLQGFTRALALAQGGRIRVNAVAPGLIDTPMTQAMPADVLAKLVARVPAGRIGSAGDIAGVVAFLASDHAAYITGQTILCCGGRSIAA